MGISWYESLSVVLTYMHILVDREHNISFYIFVIIHISITYIWKYVWLNIYNLIFLMIKALKYLRPVFDIVPWVQTCGSTIAGEKIFHKISLVTPSHIFFLSNAKKRHWHIQWSSWIREHIRVERNPCRMFVLASEMNDGNIRLRMTLK